VQLKSPVNRKKQISLNGTGSELAELYFRTFATLQLG